MTIKEKAKAYDDIFGLFQRTYHNFKYDTKWIVDKAFPELAESEDEKIRKFIHIELIRIRANESMDTPRYDDLSSAIAWLEKQKENPKSTDSIPSDAKCEDRWHKVADSFPDSAREVICKDAIGNFFIGRYYKESNSWEVSMYDDMDKSNEDNPPVVMWCDIPSEKQKEQKPTPNWMPKFLDELHSKKNYFDWDEHRDIEGHILAIINWIAPNYFEEKEQKPIEKQDYSGLNDLERAIHRGFLVAGVENLPVTIIKETAQECLEQMRPAEWSEKDERILKGIIGKIDHDQTYGVSKVEMLSFLGSLRPSWKPSEEQPCLPGIEESGIPGKDYIPVEWVDTCEKYGKWKIIQQKQPEVDLEKEYIEFVASDPVYSKLVNGVVGKSIARHFYELGLNVRKEE